jgi:hypothetical protein
MQLRMRAICVLSEYSESISVTVTISVLLPRFAFQTA